VSHSVVAFLGSSVGLAGLVVLGSCDGAASERFNGVGVVGVNAAEGGLSVLAPL
jgi:hypothetical protein